MEEQGACNLAGMYLPRKTSIRFLVGYYEGKNLLYAAKVRNGFAPASRVALFERFRGLERPTCPFKNLPESKKGRCGEGLATEDMSKCRWVEPRLVAAIEFLEWTLENHLRHSRFVARQDKGRRIGFGGTRPPKRRTFVFGASARCLT